MMPPRAPFSEAQEQHAPQPVPATVSQALAAPPVVVPFSPLKDEALVVEPPLPVSPLVAAAAPQVWQVPAAATAATVPSPRGRPSQPKPIGSFSPLAAAATATTSATAAAAATAAAPGPPLNASSGGGLSPRLPAAVAAASTYRPGNLDAKLQAQQHISANEDLIRMLAELTADLQRSNVIKPTTSSSMAS